MAPITFGSAMPAFLPPRTQVSIARFLDHMGFDNLWLADHMAYPDLSPAPDAWSIIAAMASSTRRMKLGTAVSDPHRMHPAVFAQRLATLDQVSGGRIVLGLGSGEAMNVEAYGIPWDKPVSRMLESLRVIRGLLSGGEPFTFEGQYFTLRNARLSVRPYKGRRLPIYLAALGTRTQAITGHEADGWLPVVIPAQHYAHYLAPVLAGAREAGRDPDEIERVAMVPVALGDNISFEDVKRLAKPHALSLIWKPVVERMGIPFDPPAHLRDTHYITVDPMDPESVRRYHEFQEWIPADMLPPFVVYGDMAAVKRGLGAYVEAGATHLYLMNVSPDPIGALVRIASEIIPYFARRRPPLLAQMARTALPLMEKSGMMDAAADVIRRRRQRRCR